MTAACTIAAVSPATACGTNGPKAVIGQVLSPLGIRSPFKENVEHHVRSWENFMGMMLRLMASSLALATVGLQAQYSPSLDGTWRFTMQVTDVKFPHYGEVVLTGTSGTWKIFARKAKQMMDIPCIGRVFPLTRLRSEPEVALTFKVHESETLRGCADIKVTLRAVTANKMEGTTGLGYPITMERD